MVVNPDVTMYNAYIHNQLEAAMAKRTDEKTRLNIVTLYKQGMSKRAISIRLMVSLSTVFAIIKLWEETGGVEPRPQKRGRTPLISDATLAEIVSILDAEPSTSIRIIIEKLQLNVSDTTVRNALRKRQGYKYKKKPSSQTGGSTMMQSRRGKNTE